MLKNAGFQFGNSPQDAESLKKLLLSLPLNADIIFFDNEGLKKQEYHSGIPPFCKVKKEKSNALGGEIVYIFNDNRKGEQIVTERDIPSKCDWIFRNMPKTKDIRDRGVDIFGNIRISDKYAFKSNKNVSLPNLPRPIGPHGIGPSGDIKINPLSK